MSVVVATFERPRIGNSNTIFKSGHLLISSKVADCDLVEMAGTNRGTCFNCRKPRHFLYDCPAKKQCPVCGKGIENVSKEKCQNKRQHHVPQG